MLDKFERFTQKLSSWFETVGAAAILLMVIITCIDVTGAKVFRRPLSGSFDIIVLAQLVTVSFATAFVLILGMHVKVDFIIKKLSPRAQSVIGSVVNLLSLVLFILIFWRISLYGYELQITGEVSSEIRIPFYPFAYAIAFACIPVCLVLLFQFLKSFKGVTK